VIGDQYFDTYRCFINDEICSLCAGVTLIQLIEYETVNDTQYEIINCTHCELFETIQAALTIFEHYKLGKDISGMIGNMIYDMVRHEAYDEEAAYDKEKDGWYL
jgi:hypothetical protein